MKSVKRSLLVCFLPVLCLSLNAPLWADSDQPDCSLGEGYLKRGSLFRNRVNIYDESGHRVGTLKQDPFINDRTIAWSVIALPCYGLICGRATQRE